MDGRAASDDFGRAVSKVAVAQICEAAGFQSFKESALEALADIAIRYLFDLGKMANFYANLAGRSECNVFDVIRGLEDLDASQGFSGASETIHCIAGSSTVRDIIRLVDSVEEIPFAQPVPRFPVTKNRRTIPSFTQMGETPPSKHISDWLPALPDPHTYIHTPMWNERVTEPRADKIEQARQQRKAEMSLLSLQQRLTPLPPGNKDVSPVSLPSKLSVEMGGTNNFSVLQAFAPAIEAVKSGFSDDGDEGKLVLPDARPTVHFKFKTGKKFLGEFLDLSLQKKGGGRTASWAGRDEERDDKKRRAECILRQTMDNPQELTQL
ncbi:transcription initiation factor TFIID subunit 8 [Quillaja saponaria]|uniref:Transcription initiation factor TFIID subunit 8 n=1 Tax=Quillaja saponaria TaxID=32244 RepID=A0AAD7Q049_QUISA|nr:transcription initiation factor TFIID subunit 8 [Quillaja saponaria]